MVLSIKSKFLFLLSSRFIISESAFTSYFSPGHGGHDDRPSHSSPQPLPLLLGKDPRAFPSRGRDNPSSLPQVCPRLSSQMGMSFTPLQGDILARYPSYFGWFSQCEGAAALLWASPKCHSIPRREVQTDTPLRAETTSALSSQSRSAAALLWASLLLLSSSLCALCGKN